MSTRNNYGMDYYQQFIHLSRYSRWLDNEKRRETWSETVSRYFDFFEEHMKNEYEYTFDRRELEEAVLNLEVMPSMRALMTAGPALKRDHIAGYNPVSGDSRVVTKEYGNISIKNLEGKVATVLNKDGEWTPAVFRSYGIQPVRKVTLRLNSNTVKTVKATNNHRWILLNGEVVSTNELLPMNRIGFVSAPKPEIDADYILGVRHGIVYGDGTRVIASVRSCKRVRGYHVRLCGKSKELLQFFDGYNVSYPNTFNGDPVVYLFDDFSATHDLKSLPENETDSYLLGFIRGWLAADGSVSSTSQITLCVDDTGKDWLIDNAERIGFVIQNKYEYSDRTNLGQRKKRQWSISFSRSSCIREDFLCSWKAANFKPLESHYVVESVVDEEEETEVFCAEVPNTNTFVLEKGLITGNCSFIPIDRTTAFDEILFILMCGTGVGFSVERQYVSRLPEIAEEFHHTDTTIIVADSKLGWAKALKELIHLLYGGNIPKWDLSKLRPAGARLKTFGGRSSGPGPLDELFKFTVNLFRNAAGRKLTSIECHDLVCKIAQIVVVGGVRRSALISLSNLSDDRMRNAKSGQWWEISPHRSLANNSAAYTEKPDIGIFLEEWLSLYRSKSGERGIFNRVAAQKQSERTGRRDPEYNFGTNPCGEIILREYEFCNLTEVVVRATDDLESLKRKIRIATFLGTLQSTLTDFRYINKKWKQNCQEERLLGVSLTGVMDHDVLNGSQGDEILQEWLPQMREEAIKTNKQLAELIAIPASAAITTMKPSGTVSQLVDAASGIHARHSPYYIRTVRADKKDPLAQMMVEQGFPVEDDVVNPDHTYVFSFPIKSPDGAVFRQDLTAIRHLELWKIYRTHWCEHNPSVTITVKEDEWFEVGAWVYKHFDDIGGVSFLPYSDHVYRQAPYQDCTKEEYEAYVAKMPQNVDWSSLSKYEIEDHTTGTQEAACSAGACEVVDLVA